MLNISGIGTSQSCAGHVEEPNRDVSTIPYRKLIHEEHKVIGGPWINLEMDYGDATFSSELEQEQDYARRCVELEIKMLTLLDEFYTGRTVPTDARLYFEGEGSYTLTNQGSRLLRYASAIPREQRAQKLSLYQKEISDFADFLKQRFVREYQVADPKPVLQLPQGLFTLLDAFETE